MTALVNNDHLTNIAVGNHLRKSQCGIKRGSHKVCCDISSIDFGTPPVEDSTNRLLDPVLPISTPSSRIDDTATCGKLNSFRESPLKWIGEIYFETKRAGKKLVEPKCLGVLITYKHLVVSAHCINIVSANYTL